MKSNLVAEVLPGFFLKEVGPLVYNKAVANAQARLQAQVMELDVEVYEAECQCRGNLAHKKAPRISRGF